MSAELQRGNGRLSGRKFDEDTQGNLEVKGKCCFQTEYVADVDNSLGDLITHGEPSKSNAELNAEDRILIGASR